MGHAQLAKNCCMRDKHTLAKGAILLPVTGTLLFGSSVEIAAMVASAGAPSRGRVPVEVVEIPPASNGPNGFLEPLLPSLAQVA